MRTANLAILFTAIQGFTERTSRQTLEQNQQLLRTHAELLAPLFKAFGGRVLKAIGDTFLVTFESPTQALLGAVAVQDRLWLHNRTAPRDERLEVRLALNVGEVRVEAGDVFGEPVNIASRVLAVAEPGEVVFTEAVFLAMNKAEVPSEEVGAYSLKGIPEKVRVYRVPHAPGHTPPPGEGEAGEAPPAEPAVPPFGSLGLSRVPAGGSRSAALELAEILGEGMADLRTRAGEHVSGLRARALPWVEGLSTQSASWAAEAQEQVGALTGRVREAGGRLRARWGARSRAVVLLVVGALVLAGGGALLLRDPVLAEIARVEGTEGEERAARVEAARRRIAAVHDEAREAYYTGRLEEALGAGERAVWRYRSAAREGVGDAEDRLVDLLEAEDCRTRAAAAHALGELKVRSAKGALETLAERGGPGESDLPLFGCDSRRAARSALERM